MKEKGCWYFCVLCAKWCQLESWVAKIYSFVLSFELPIIWHLDYFKYQIKYLFYIKIIAIIPEDDLLNSYRCSWFDFSLYTELILNLCTGIIFFFSAYALIYSFELRVVNLVLYGHLMELRNAMKLKELLSIASPACSMRLYMLT